MSEYGTRAGAGILGIAGILGMTIKIKINKLNDNIGIKVKKRLNKTNKKR